ncbi:MAG: prolipoprotein diacylglyceryl transferase [Candidatus Binatia bacterium]
MIPPYAGPMVLSLGPLSFPIFGLLVATGVIVGHAVVMRLAKEKEVPAAEIRAAAAWALGAGFFGAHAFDVLLYHPDKLSRDGVVAFLKIQDGISSFGGFFGALVGVAFYFHRLGKAWWVHADILVQGLVVGWIFGRLGCALTSDHVGHLSNFALAFSYPGGPRHNVGFYELLYTALVLLPALLLLRTQETGDRYRFFGERSLRPGIYVAVMSAFYAPARFALDFLRAADLPNSDPRVLGLTGAQYFCIALLAMALWIFHRAQRPTA